MYTAVQKEPKEKRSIFDKNARETLEKRLYYVRNAWETLLAQYLPYLCSVGLYNMPKHVGATHSPARGCAATHSPCIVRGTNLGYLLMNSKGPSWIYGLCESGMVRAPNATVLDIRILTSMWILVLVFIYTKGHIYTFMQI